MKRLLQKKLVSALVNYKLKKSECLYLGNLDSKRDWGHAQDYMLAAWKILQHKKPDDFCIGTGVQYSIREFVEKVCKKLDLSITWKGNGLKEVAINNNKIFIKVSKRYFRPTEVDSLRADFSKAKKDLNWSPKKISMI